LADIINPRNDSCVTGAYLKSAFFHYRNSPERESTLRQAQDDIPFGKPCREHSERSG
jgi:hypothetical protein